MCQQHHSTRAAITRSEFERPNSKPSTLKFEIRNRYASYKLAQAMPGGAKLTGFTRILHRTKDDAVVGEVGDCAVLCVCVCMGVRQRGVCACVWAGCVCARVNGVCSSAGAQVRGSKQHLGPLLPHHSRSRLCTLHPPPPTRP